MTCSDSTKQNKTEFLLYSTWLDLTPGRYADAGRIRLTNCEADTNKLTEDTKLCPFDFKFTPDTRVMRFVGRPFAPREIRDAFIDYYKAKAV